MTEDFPYTWIETLTDILHNGKEVSPRGQLTKEIPQRTIKVDMRKPVLTIPARKLSYKFMVAEAYWILTGDNKVSTIAPYNKNIGQFSDNGETFFGAYGPKVIDQFDYVVNKLVEDPESRQAGLTIWRESPPETKDVPCTVALFFSIRNDKLNCHVFMRSSDAWLGLPYDVFNFSMISHMVCCALNTRERYIRPGLLYLTAASSHLYERNFEQAWNCISAPTLSQPLTPRSLFEDKNHLLNWMKDLRGNNSYGFLRWWDNPICDPFWEAPDE